MDHRFKLEDAVSVAAELGDVNILETLLDSMKSDKEIEKVEKRVEEILAGDDETSSTGTFGRTPLHKAAYRGKYDMVRLLLKLGASPNSVGPKEDISSQASVVTPLDSCVYGMSITPPQYGRNVTAANKLEYFEDHFRF